MIKKFTIFVLDDDEPFCGLLTAVVKQGLSAARVKGYEIALKTYYDMENLIGAVEWVKENKPDLILLDYMLGNEVSACLDSLDMLKKFLPYCDNIKILTGLWDEDVRLELVKEGFDKMDIEVIQKPFSTHKLLQMLGNAFGQRKNV